LLLIVAHFARRAMDYLMNPKNLWALIAAYTFFVFTVLLISSTIYNLVEVSGLGYIKYGICTENFDQSMILTDKNISRDFFYFSAITFFTVGYGDICPMGLTRVVSMIVAFAGHVISVIIVALVVNNYLRSKNKAGK
ncbi:MAG: potassium channel family protein, partial [Candidatus Micrarchaeota archaeon]